ISDCFYPQLLFCTMLDITLLMKLITNTRIILSSILNSQVSLRLSAPLLQTLLGTIRVQDQKIGILISPLSIKLIATLFLSLPESFAWQMHSIGDTTVESLISVFAECEMC